MTAVTDWTHRPALRRFWLAGAPLSVVAGLMAAANVFVVFAVYQVGFCLLLPALVNVGGRGFSPAEHLAHLGLGRKAARRGLWLGLGLGGLFAAAILGVFHWLGHLFLADHDVPGTLAAWGVTRSNLPLVLWFMTLVNGPAEEMYWRGFVQQEIGGDRPGFGPILLISLFYASYHGLTVHLLVGALPVSILFLAAVGAAGSLWGWMRARTGSLWPAVISHTAATGAYLAVAGPLFET